MGTQKKKSLKKHLQKSFILFLTIVIMLMNSSFVFANTEGGDRPSIKLSPDNTIIRSGQTSVLVDPSLEITAATTNLTNAIVKIESTPNGIDESLGIRLSNGMTAVYSSDTRSLTITGVAPIHTYQEVLRTISYRNSSSNPDISNRIITFTVTDASGQVSPLNQK